MLAQETGAKAAQGKHFRALAAPEEILFPVVLPHSQLGPQ